jgi:hypothetical protein
MDMGTLSFDCRSKEEIKMYASVLGLTDTEAIYCGGIYG